jgi:capsular polysaccharide biosynthesis protein
MVEHTAHDGDDYWAALYRRRWLILLVATLSAVFSGFFSSVITPLYEASAQFYVPQDATTSPESGLMPTLIRGPILRDQARTYVAVLESRDASIAVADQLKNRSLEDVLRAADFDVSPSASIVVYARDKDPTVAKRMVELFVQYFRTFYSLRLNDTPIVVEKPFVSQKPVFPIVALNTMIGAVGGVLLGIIYGLFLDYLQVRALAKRMRELERQDWLNSIFAEELDKSE